MKNIEFLKKNSHLCQEKRLIESQSSSNTTKKHHHLHFILACQNTQNIKINSITAQSLHLSHYNRLFSFPYLFIYSIKPLTPLLIFSSQFISFQFKQKFLTQTSSSLQSTAPVTQL